MSQAQIGITFETLVCEFQKCQSCVVDQAHLQVINHSPTTKRRYAFKFEKLMQLNSISSPSLSRLIFGRSMCQLKLRKTYQNLSKYVFQIKKLLVIILLSISALRKLRRSLMFTEYYLNIFFYKKIKNLCLIYNFFIYFKLLFEKSFYIFSFSSSDFYYFIHKFWKKV